MTVSREHSREVSDPSMSLTRSDIEEFLYREARYADEHRYDEWEALWTDDALYWVPAGGGDIDPTKHVSLIYDNRARISTRIAQLNTGNRFAQTPRSQLRRIVSNIEVQAARSDEHDVQANFILSEFQTDRVTFWAGCTEYRLRQDDGQLFMAYKKVTLVNSHGRIPTIGFLL